MTLSATSSESASKVNRPPNLSANGPPRYAGGPRSRQYAACSSETILIRSGSSFIRWRYAILIAHALLGRSRVPASWFVTRPC